MLMSVIHSPRGASAGALVFALAVVGAQAQEALPAIDIGSAAGAGSGPGSRTAPGGPGDPAAYSRTEQTLATRTRTPVMHTPAVTNVVPQQVLKDQQVVRVEEALKNVSGVYLTPIGGLQPGFLIRGFQNNRYFLDGVRVETLVTPISEEMADIQQVEVQKGPASILYGRLEAGGFVNLTTKKPLDTQYNSVQQQFSSFNSYRTTVDSTGPLTADKSLLYRFDAAYESSDSFIDYAHDRHVFVAPRVRWSPTDDTQFDFYLRYLNGTAPVVYGAPVLLDANGKAMAVAPVPRSRNYGEPGSQSNSSDLRVGFAWSHAFDADWSLSHRFDADFIDTDTKTMIAWGPGSPCGATSCAVERLVSRIAPTTQAYFTSLDLTGHVDTFGLKHTILAGSDLYLYHLSMDRIYNFSAPSIDLYNPVHTGYPAYLFATPDSGFHTEKNQRLFGLYFQDQIELPYDFHLLAGFRWDNTRASTEQLVSIPSASVNSGRESFSVVKPRVGLLWQPIPELSLFGDYVEGFGLSKLFSWDSAQSYYLPPEESRQWEGGIKTSLLDGRLTGTLAYYDIVKTNVPAPSKNPALAAIGEYEATGEVENRGLDVDVTGQITPELKAIGSFSYIDSKITKDESGNVGHRFYGVPRFGGSLWAVYEPQFEALRGFAFGAGFFARSSFAYDNANSFSLPGFTTVDLMARYAFEFEKTKVTFQLNVTNLGDETYYTVSSGGGGAFAGTPRVFRGSMKVEF
jgi:iron complex outermembrane receptor protein